MNEKDKNVVLWCCPVACEIDHVLVCGGDLGNPLSGNIYFQMELDGTYTNLHSDGAVGVLQECFEHADGGCCMEPICPECRSACVKNEGVEFPITLDQKVALRALAKAYGNLSHVWGNSWEGPDKFGGVLYDFGLLPERQLEEAEAELLSLIGDQHAVISENTMKEENSNDEK